MRRVFVPMWGVLDGARRDARGCVWGGGTHLTFSIPLFHDHTHTHTHTHSRSLSHTHTISLSLSLSLSHTHTHTHTLALSHTHTHTLALSLTHTHTLSLSHTHTHTHTHTHSLGRGLTVNDPGVSSCSLVCLFRVPTHPANIPPSFPCVHHLNLRQTGRLLWRENSS